MQALNGFSTPYVLSISIICGDISDQQSNVITMVLDSCFVLAIIDIPEYLAANTQLL